VAERHLASFCRNGNRCVRASGRVEHANATDGAASCCIETPFVCATVFYTIGVESGRKIGGFLVGPCGSGGAAATFHRNSW
jgi:hypothetical protein